MRRVRLVSDLARHGAFGWLGGHFEHRAIGGDFPAVIKAAQTAFLVAAVKQRRVAVRAEFSNQSDCAVRIAKRDKILAEKAHAHRIAVALHQFFAKRRGQPMPPHDLTHRRRAFDATKQIIVLRGHSGTFQTGGNSAPPIRRL